MWLSLGFQLRAWLPESQRLSSAFPKLGLGPTLAYLWAFSCSEISTCAGRVVCSASPCQTRSCTSIETMAVLATPEHLLTDQPHGGCSARVVVMGVIRLKWCFIGRWCWSFTSGLEWKLSLATDSHMEGSVIIPLSEAQRLRLTLQLAKSVGSLRSSEDELMGSGCVAPRSLLACLPH